MSNRGLRFFHKKRTLRGSNILEIPKIMDEDDQNQIKFDNMQHHFSSMHLPTFLSGSCFLLLIDQALSHPYDVVRTRQQVKSMTTWEASRSVYIEKKFRGFYTGFCPSAVGHLPGTVIYYLSYTYFKDKFQDIHNRNHSNENSGGQALWVSFISAALADMSAILFYAPVDVVIQRLFLQSPTKALYRSWAHIVNTIYVNEGLKGFYKGICPLAINTLPATALWWTVYEEFKQRFAILLKGKNSSKVVQKDQRANFLAGGFAGFITTAVTNPLDVVRTRMQVASMHDTAHLTATQMISNIYKKDGLKAFGRGFLPRLVTSSVISGISAFFYELLVDVSVQAKYGGFN